MKKQPFRFSFLWIIGAAGGVMLLIIIGNLSLLGLHRFPGEPRRYLNEGREEGGHLALQRHGCGACHIIPGIPGATGRVGPSLEDFARQVVLAGQLPNTPENLVAWILDPQAFNPKTLMPDLGVSQSEAEDMAAYLYR